MMNLPFGKHWSFRSGLDDVLMMIKMHINVSYEMMCDLNKEKQIERSISYSIVLNLGHNNKFIFYFDVVK